MLNEKELIHDWNSVEEGDIRPSNPRVELNDETLRDGLQSPSVRSPSIEEKVEILHLMGDLGIDAADLGLPGAGPHVVKDVARLAQEIADHNLPISANCAARTVIRDIEPIARISQEVGLPIEAACFIGSSPIRQYTEGWSIDQMVKLSRDAIEFAVGENLPVMFVTEDTTRARPDDLRTLYTAAVEAGARRVCIADTVGHATPNGVRRLVRFIREVVDATGEDVTVDWHGHRDRGLSVINALAAAEAGADRLHATALGVGERVGNTPMDILLVNFHLLGWRQGQLDKLPEWCELVARTTGVPLPDNYPVLGKDAFRTGTGVHAAAIIKAQDKGDSWLADRIYSGVPAQLVGCRQKIEIGPMSGLSNVLYWLRDRGIVGNDELAQVIFEQAKARSRMLTDDEIVTLCTEKGVALA